LLLLVVVVLLLLLALRGSVMTLSDRFILTGF